MKYPTPHIIGLPVVVIVNDPRDLTTTDGSVRIDARITAASTFASGADEERLLIELRQPVEWHGNSYGYCVARHRHGLVDDLARGCSAECSLVAVTREQATSAGSLDTAGWRGGLAARATLEPLVPGD